MEKSDSQASQVAAQAAHPPAEMHNFVIYVSDKGYVEQEVHGELCYLYENLGIAHIRGLHVDFLEPGSKLKNTLDAPEGYLYMRDFVRSETEDARIGPDHPFYERIGGKKANLDLLTTTTRLVGGLPAEVTRHRNDIDLMGRGARKVIYRRSDGTVVSSMRAYRDASQAMLYGIDQCEMRRVINNQVQVTLGDVAMSDEKLKKITVRSLGGKTKMFFGESPEGQTKSPEEAKSNEGLPGKD